MWGAMNIHRWIPALSSDEPRATGQSLAGELRPQPGTSALGDLAVLLRGPSVDGAKLAPVDLTPELMDEHESLIARQLVYETADAA
jgi:hypothetical protein